jgi:3-hydroxyacyl-[acyl-carrier-protein] dehydratase
MSKPAEQATISEEFPRVLETADLLRLLPHRYPFLMVDRVIEIDRDQSCIGIKNVTVNEPFFPGHFPGRPVFPGVLLLEGMAQTAGVICGMVNSRARPPSVFLLTIDKAKFRKPVLPGYVVEYHMRQMTRRKKMWWYRGEAKVDGQVVAEAEVGALLTEG